MAAVLHSCYRFGYQYYRCSNAVLSVLGGLFLKKSAMDTNEINLDEFDKSDISSDWNSSEDEAPTMEVEEEKASLPAQQTQQPMDYAQEIEELEQMENEDNPNYVPSGLPFMSVMCRDEERGRRLHHRSGADQRRAGQLRFPDEGRYCFSRAGRLSHHRRGAEYEVGDELPGS